MKKIRNQWLSSRKLTQYLRGGIQLLFFLLFPSAFSSAFTSIRSIFTQLGLGAPIAMSSFLAILLVLCGYTILFGRFFCGYACAFGTLGDAVHGIFLLIWKRLGKKPPRNQSWYRYLSLLKYGVLLAIVLLCFFGGYSKLTGWNPWDVFSMFMARNFHFSGYLPGILLLVGILVGMALVPRFFCRFLCPMGAVFSLLPVLPLLSPRRDTSACAKGCSACRKCCPANLELPDRENGSVSGDCFQCQKCVSICPKKNACSAPKPLRGNESWITLFKALALFAVLAVLLW